MVRAWRSFDSKATVEVGCGSRLFRFVRIVVIEELFGQIGTNGGTTIF